MMTFERERAAVPQHVLVRILDRESVLLNLETEEYFGLDETGTRMSQLVTTLPNIDAAYQELLAEFEVEPGNVAVKFDGTSGTPHRERPAPRSPR